MKKREAIKSVVVLTVICAVVALMLSGVNELTAPIIEENQSKGEFDSFYEAMPDAEGFEEVSLTGLPETVKAVYKDTGNKGYVVLLSTRSQYTGTSNMGITVGIGTDGKIVGITLTSYTESKDFGREEYPKTYIGKDSALVGVDLVGGVTYSSAAFRDAVSDAFTALISSGLISEDQKSDAQLIDELKTVALPGCANNLGNAMLTQIEVSGSYIKEAYEANNGCGYVYVLDVDGTPLVCGVGAFGDAVCYALDGTDVTSDAAYANAISEAVAVNAKKSEEAAVANIELIAPYVYAGDDATITAVSPKGIFNTVTGAFEITSDSTKSYGFVSVVFGYRNQPMKMIYILDEDGAIVAFRSAGELMILDSEYYSGYTLDESAYKANFEGLTAETFDESVTLISGATITANAVATATRDVFAAFDALVTGEVE